jgi:hypothetical protein
MRKAIFAVAALGVLLAVVPAAVAQCVTGVNGQAGDTCTTLYAGQTIDAGTVCSSVNGDNLDVTFTTTGGWELEEAHLWVGTQLSDMPQTKKGNPKIGNFPYNSGDISGSTSHTFSVSLAGLDFSCPGDDVTYLLAAHAALRKDNGDGTFQTETGWGDGPNIVDRGSWATYTEVTLSCDCDGGGPPNASCETAYATSLSGGAAGSDDTSSCFFSTAQCPDTNDDGVLETIGNNWGWQLGPIEAGTVETFNLHAGAGQCDTGKGYVAGTVTVNYDGMDLTVDVNVDSAGDELGAVQVYAEYALQCTTAPGQYTILGNSGVHDNACDTTSYQVSATNFNGGPIYVSAHAEVCPDTNSCE